MAQKNIELFITRGQLKVNLEEESVQLGLGEGIGTLVFDGVLRRDHHERRGKRTRLPIDADLVFFHCFKKSRLGLGRRAVDFVRKEKIREDRTGAEFEFALAVVPHE